MRIVFSVGFVLGAMALTWITVGFATFHACIFWYLHVLHSHDGQVGLGAMALAVWMGGLCALVVAPFAAVRSWRAFNEH